MTDTQVLAYEQMPREVWQTLLVPLGWLGWLVLAAMIFRLFVAGFEFMTKSRRGELDSDASTAVVMTIVAAVVFGSAGAIAGYLLAPP